MMLEYVAGYTRVCVSDMLWGGPGAPLIAFAKGGCAQRKDGLCCAVAQCLAQCRLTGNGQHTCSEWTAASPAEQEIGPGLSALAVALVSFQVLFSWTKKGNRRVLFCFSSRC